MRECVWCDLDGRAGCPVHYRRDGLAILVVGLIVAVFAVLLTIAAFGAMQ